MRHIAATFFMAGRETPAHLALKRHALIWAQQQGFRIAAAEVSVPTLGWCRLDAAAYRPEFKHKKGGPERLGATAIFECKQSRADFLRDSRRAEEISIRLAQLHARRQLYEESMRVHFPSLRNGEALFPEFDGYRFEAAGYEPYDQLVAEIRTLSRRLHAQTKFSRLVRWKAANLHYVVAEPGVARSHELPAGWGLLVRAGEALETETAAVWQEASDHDRWNLLTRIAMCGTKAINRSLGITGASLRGEEDEEEPPAPKPALRPP
jgi:hypothetical protein